MDARSPKTQPRQVRPARGMRDFLARDLEVRRWVMEVIRSTYEAFGFEPLETPALEDLEILLDKYGEEGEKLLFRVLKRGDKLAQALEEVAEGRGQAARSLADLGLRYDLTVPLARVVASHWSELVFPYKRYQIQPVWRADRPARGRFREFYQCDADVVGAGPPVAEAELLAAAAEALRKLGFEDFEIRVNHRGLLLGLLRASGVDEALHMEAVVALDKLDKIGWAGVEKELVARGIEGPGQVARVFDVQDLEPGDWLGRIDVLAGRVDETGREAAQELAALFRLCEAEGIGAQVRLDPTLARGLSYYTGPIFEITSPGLAVSLAGGGRYDDLVGSLAGRPLPACGISLGLERIVELLQGRKGARQSHPDVLVCCWDEALAVESLRLARQLRSEGFSVDLYPGAGKLGKQLKYAVRRGMSVALILGPDEVAEGRVGVKELATGQQTWVSREEVARSVAAILSGTGREE